MVDRDCSLEPLALSICIERSGLLEDQYLLPSPEAWTLVGFPGYWQSYLVK